MGGFELTTIASVGTSAASSNATYEYIDLWSRSTTWGGGPPPVEGDSVWIQPGQRILYDVSSPRLYMLIIQGEFIFDRADLTLDANYIFVMGGSFVVGTEDEPFLHQALIFRIERRSGLAKEQQLLLVLLHQTLQLLENLLIVDTQPLSHCC